MLKFFANLHQKTILLTLIQLIPIDLQWLGPFQNETIKLKFYSSDMPNSKSVVILTQLQSKWWGCRCQNILGVTVARKIGCDLQLKNCKMALFHPF